MDKTRPFRICNAMALPSLFLFPSLFFNFYLFYNYFLIFARETPTSARRVG